MTPAPLTPIQMLASLAAVGLLLTIVAGSIVGWSMWISGRRIKSTAIGPQATVGLIDLVMTIVVLFTLFFFAMVTWRSFFKPSVLKVVAVVSALQQLEPIKSESTPQEGTDDSAQGSDIAPPVVKETLTERQFIFSGFAITSQLICVLLMTGFICARTGCPLKRIGWRCDQLGGDLLSGLQCFVMLTPPLFVLNAFLIKLTDVPYEHPIQKMMEQFPWLLGIAFWQVSIVAPISEEFAFRALLIGWFESIHFSKNKIEAWIFGLKASQPEVCTQRDLVLGNSPKIDFAGPSSMDPYIPPILEPHANNRQGDESRGGDKSLPAPRSAKHYNPPWWPAVLSGVLFGLAHYSYGISWVSLIVFGIVLGRLYQVRQSLVPVILFHFLFNSLSIIMFGLKLLMPVQLTE